MVERAEVGHAARGEGNIGREIGRLSGRRLSLLKDYW